jgi:signal transduction histidine kinase
MSSAASLPGEPAEILVVEDSPTQAEKLRHLLERDGHLVTVAGDAAQALAFLGERRPALIITDIVMPEMDGYDLCRQVKSDERTRGIPVVLLTSLADVGDVVEGLVAGADSFITKPYREDYLLSSIDRTLAAGELLESEHVRVDVEVVFAGRSRFISADPQQILTLLLSTYEAAVSRNLDLVQAQQDLRSLNQRLESIVAERTATLEERVKELRCLYAISGLVAEPGRSINESLEAAVDLIPLGWQDPEKARARILFEGREFASAGFRETAWKRSAEIVISGETVGTVEVCHLEDGSARRGGWFLPEEQDLLVDIARQLGAMVERRRAEQQVLELNEALEERVVERTAELEAANRGLESFGYSISHDLRAPLRAINGFAAALAGRYRDELDEKGRHYIDTIVDSSDRMGVLIEELLAYSRLGRGSVRTEPVPLEPLVAGLRATFGGRIEVAGGTLEVVEPLAVPVGDPMLLERILANLVDNALTYRNPDIAPHVTVRATRHGDSVTITVADNGIGIAPASLERIFEVFSRLHSDDAYAGTGIGLSIVRKAARLMGSDVTLESVEGEGTTFSLELPAAPEGILP